MRKIQEAYRRSMNYLQLSLNNYLDAVGRLAEGMERRGIDTHPLNRLLACLEALQNVIERKNEICFDVWQTVGNENDATYVKQKRHSIRYFAKISQKIKYFNRKFNASVNSLWQATSGQYHPAPPWLLSPVKTNCG